MSTLKTIYLQHLNGSNPNMSFDAAGNVSITGNVTASKVTANANSFAWSAGTLSESVTGGVIRYETLRSGSSHGLYIGPKSLTNAYLQVASTSGTANGDLYLNPFGGKTYVSPYPLYESAWVQVNTGGNYFFSHGLGRQPIMIRVFARFDNAGDNKPWLCAGDIGAFSNPNGTDYGIVSGVSNSLICVAVGENGVSGDWGNTGNNGFPTNDNAFETFYTANGQNAAGDFMDTPGETASTWNAPWIKVYAW